MPIPFKTYLIKEAALIATLNAAINASYTWWLWRSLDPLTLFGASGVGLDLALTPAVIALLSTLIGTGFARRKIADGRVAAPSGDWAPALRLLPRGVPLRSAVMAAACGVLLSLPLWLALHTSGIKGLSLLAACGAKVGITVAFSLVIVPVVSLAALADLRRPSGGLALA